MARRKKNNQIFEDIGGVRSQITNENESLNYDVIEPNRESIPRLVEYIENQVDNLKDYAENLKKLCKDDICASILESQIRDLDEIKSSLCRRLDNGIYPIEEPNMDPMGFYISLFESKCTYTGRFVNKIKQSSRIFRSYTRVYGEMN